MIVLDPGHSYRLDILDDDHQLPLFDDKLVFVKREGPGYPGNVGHHPGTNIQEVLRALIDRMWYLDAQEHAEENGPIIFALREALKLLEVRAAKRHHRPIPKFLSAVEGYPTCKECGHIHDEDYIHES